DGRTGLRMHVATGTLTPDELENALLDAYRRPDYRPEGNSLCDVREAGVGTFTGEEIRRVVDTVLKHRGAPPETRTAIVVGRDLSFGPARMFAQQLEAESPSDVAVFRDMDEAMAWLEGDEKE
ncbi:MAG: hypothetical protein KAJ04_04095, partial [Candidatus Eisenbacteria sp.]|nr:hypothetical protein [Candidatus Eisenbacteria bacterium]